MPPPAVRAGAIFFLTICGEPRAKNQFANPTAWSAVRRAAEHYHQQVRWHVRLLLAMPDHIHLLASFPREEGIGKVVGAWKHYLAHSADFEWQRDFFDHRLRASESLDEKADYIRANPVRAGLIGSAEAWPYVWVPEDLIATPFD